MIYAYPQPGKPKARAVCEAFCHGVRGVVSGNYRLHEGDAAFYGVLGIEELFYDALTRRGCNWYYLDNAYFDKLRGKFFRVGVNRLQSVADDPDFNRMKQLGIELAPWRTDGKHVLVVDQSDFHMSKVARWPGGITAWRGFVLSRLRNLTDRLIVCREWKRDKAEQAIEFSKELRKAWIVVTHASAAACEAVLQGVPVLVTDPYCAAAQMSGDWGPDSIEKPMRHDARDAWAARLCASQWTLDELRRATWRKAGS